MQNSIYGSKFSPNDENAAVRAGRPASPLTIPEDCEPSHEAFTAVVDQLIDDVIADFCFQVHPATKIGVFKADDDEPAFDETEDIFGQKKGKLQSTIICPICKRQSEATRFASHLEKCMSGGKGRNNRNAKKVNVDTYNESDVEEEDEDENESSDVSYSSSSRKRTKKKNSKNTSRKKVLRDMSSESAGSFQPPADMESFLLNYCGVKSKHTKKMCMNTLNCAQHPDELRLEIRRKLLPNFMSQSQSKAEDVPIDVDTVDEDVSTVHLGHHFSRNSTPQLFNNYSK